MIGFIVSLKIIIFVSEIWFQIEGWTHFLTLANSTVPVCCELSYRQMGLINQAMCAQIQKGMSSDICLYLLLWFSLCFLIFPFSQLVLT